MALLQCSDLLSGSEAAAHLSDLLADCDENPSSKVIPRFCCPCDDMVAPQPPGSTLQGVAAGMPTPLFCELVLCIRNGREVLASLNCDLRRRSALCTVYVCSKRLDALLGSGDRQKCLEGVRIAAKRLISDGCQVLWERLNHILDPSSDSIDAEEGDRGADCCYEDEEDEDEDDLVSFKS